MPKRIAGEAPGGFGARLAQLRKQAGLTQADRKFKPPVRTQPAHDTGSPNRPYVEPKLRGCMVCVGYSDRQ